MGVKDLADSRVPVREGQYGARVVAVEPGGIEYIPERERHGHPLDLFWTWMSPNLEFATVFVGVLPIAIFGGGFWPTALGVVLGTALGSLTHGILSAMGPRFGVPQMVWSRGAFGYLGNLLPAGLNAFTAGVGWFAVNSVSGTFALVTLSELLNKRFGTPIIAFQLALAIVVLVQVGVAFVGHNMVHQFEKVLFPYLAIVFAASTVIILAETHYGLGFNPQAPAAAGGPSGAFILAFFIAYGYAVGWNPYASDYTRYLAPNSSPWRVGLAAGLGVFVSCAILEIAGAGAATISPLGNNPTTQFTSPLPELLQILVLLGIAAGGVAANVLNIYSASMSFLTLGIRLGLRLRRAIVALSFGVLGLVVALRLQANVGPGSKYESFLLLITYWITPYLAVTLVDYWLRRGRYEEAEFYDPSRRPWQGVVAMLAGMLASVPFWDQDLFTGPIPHSHPELGDLSFFVGFIVAGVLYYVLRQTYRQPAVSLR